jgi:hypothetical protein
LIMGDVTVSTDVVAGSFDFGLSGTLTIEDLAYNHAAATFERLDWTTAFDDVLNPGAMLPTPVDLTIDLAASLQFRVSGSVTGTGSYTTTGFGAEDATYSEDLQRGAAHSGSGDHQRQCRVCAVAFDHRCGHGRQRQCGFVGCNPGLCGPVSERSRRGGRRSCPADGER